MTKKKRPRPRSQAGRSTGGSRQREATARARAAAAARAERETVEPSDTWSAETGLRGEGEDAVPAGDEALETEPAASDEAELASEEDTEAPRPLPRPGTKSARPPAARTRARTARPAPPGGLFGGLRAASPYPLFRETMARSASVVAGSPPLVLLPLLLVLVVWLLLLAVGLDHVPLGFMDLLAIPPIGSFFDLNIAGTLSPTGAGGIALLFGLTLLRAVILAVLMALIVDRLNGITSSTLTLARALRAMPTVVGYCVANLVLIYVAQYLSLILGSLGGLVSILTFVGALYFLAFTPIVPLTSFVPFREALRRSVAAARLPGSRHVGLVLLYFLITVFPLQYSLQAPGPFTANPSIRQWLIVLGVTLLHVLFMAAFAHRYLAVEDEIPDAQPRPARSGRRAR